MIDDCAQIEDLIFYALKLEKAAIAVQRLIEAGDMQSAIRVIHACTQAASWLARRSAVSSDENRN